MQTASRSIIAAKDGLGHERTAGDGADAVSANGRVVLVRDSGVEIHGPLKGNDDAVNPGPVKGFVPVFQTAS
ncbi:MAG: hypothetical protein ABII82_13930 [Verrucomicrobiota bacterium]